MKLNRFTRIFQGVFALALLVFAIGCSGSNPTGNMTESDQIFAVNNNGTGSGEPEMLKGRITEIFEDKQAFTVEAYKYVVVVNEDTRAITWPGRSESAFDFKMVAEGSHVQVTGTLQSDNTFQAVKIEIKQNQTLDSSELRSD